MGQNLCYPTKNSHQQSLPTSQLTESEVSTLRAETGMEREDIIEWHANFLAEYPNGFITKKEFVKLFLKSKTGTGSARQYAEIVFNAFNLYQKGVVSFREWLLVVSYHSDVQANKLKQIDFAFSIFDIDKDERISRRDMRRVQLAIYEMLNLNAKDRKSRVEEIFRLYDTNGDGFLDKTEFIAFIRSDPVCCNLFAL